MVIADGFPGQRLTVVPRPLIREALQRAGTSHLVVTDCGYYPDARAHGMTRLNGIGQAVLIVCVRGAGWCEIGGVRHTVRAGQVLVVPPGEPHSYQADQDDPWTVWWLHVAGPDLPELLRTSRLTARAPVREVPDLYRVVGLVEEVVRVLERDSAATSLLVASGAAWHLLAILSALSDDPGVDSSPIDRARDYLREHLADHLSINDLAAMAHLSASHFASLFRARVGVPPLRYLTDLRMARARELLDTTDRTIASIAEEVGYRDPFYFSRQFSAIHGVTPRAYRAQHKG